ncbi:hypothetical protein ACFV16_34725 [Streptomyces massasporeus]|uniref:hypothetical protein n=1 Tax=Streptomyces massasporeus TaxID=67324 RepID=UPI0036926D80
MRIFARRSLSTAACAALLLVGTAAAQASANHTDYTTNPSPVDGNNNTAGNDLIIGNNNTAGTGHTTTNSVMDSSPLFSLTNKTSDITFTYASDASNCSNCTLWGVAPPNNTNFRLLPGVNAVAFFSVTNPGNDARATFTYTGSDGARHNLHLNYYYDSPWTCTFTPGTGIESCEASGAEFEVN